MIITERTSVGRQDLAIQIKWILSVRGCIALVRHPIMLARLNVIGWNFKVSLEMVWSFDHGGHKTRGDVVFDVAMEEPYTGVVSAEAPYRPCILVQHDCVSAYGGG